MGLPCYWSCLKPECGWAAFAVHHQTEICNRHMWSTQCGKIFVQCGTNCITSPLRYFEADVPEECQCISIHSDHAVDINFPVLSTSLQQHIGRFCGYITDLRKYCLQVGQPQVLALVCRSRRPRFSGFTFGVISRSQFIGRRYLSAFSFRFVSSSLLSHLKFTIFASSQSHSGLFSPCRWETARFHRVKNRFRPPHWFRSWSHCSYRRQL